MQRDQRQVTAQLYELSAQALRQASRADVVEALARTVRGLLDVDQVHFIEVSQDATVGHGKVAASDAADARVGDSYVQVIDERPSGTAHVISTGEPLVVADAPSSDRLRPDYVERFGVASACFIPLAWSGDVREVMVMISQTPRDFGDEEVRTARLAANIAASGLALREAEAQMDARHDHDAALARAARALNDEDDLVVVLRALAREAGLSVGGDMAGFYLGDGEKGGIATAGYNTPPGWDGYLMRPGEGVGGQVLASGSAVIANSYQTDVRLPEHSALRTLQTAVAVPMRWEGALRGSLSIGFERMRRVRESDLRTLQAIADLAAVACAMKAASSASGS